MSSVTERPRKDPSTSTAYAGSNASAAAAPAAATATRRRPEDIDFDGNVRVSPELDAYHRSLPSSRTPEQAGSPMAIAIDRAKKSAEVQATMDGVRDRFSGPYKVEGQVVTAPPMFRMNGGANMDNMRKHETELDKIASGARAIGLSARGGYGPPGNLVKVTQALIDAGKLPPGPGSISDRIRSMQWEWGIGVDCAAYTHHTLQATTKKRDLFGFGIRAEGTEDFTELAKNSRFAKIAVKDVRPGDVITLRSLSEVGHNVTVYGHTIATEQTRADLARRLPPEARTMLGWPGPLHVIEVDSAWGAGPNGASRGGYRRDTWLYDESNNIWGYVDRQKEPPVFKTSTVGPANDLYSGAFRSKGAV